MKIPRRVGSYALVAVALTLVVGAASGRLFASIDAHGDAPAEPYPLVACATRFTLAEELLCVPGVGEAAVFAPAVPADAVVDPGPPVAVTYRIGETWLSSHLVTYTTPASGLVPAARHTHVLTTNLATGHRLSDVPVSPEATALVPAPDVGLVLAGATPEHTALGDGGAPDTVAIDPLTSDVRWVAAGTSLPATGTAAFAAPTGTTGVALTAPPESGGKGCTVRALDLATGTELWRTSLAALATPGECDVLLHAAPGSPLVGVTEPGDRPSAFLTLDAETGDRLDGSLASSPVLAVRSDSSSDETLVTVRSGRDDRRHVVVRPDLSVVFDLDQAQLDAVGARVEAFEGSRIYASGPTGYFSLDPHSPALTSEPAIGYPVRSVNGWTLWNGETARYVRE